MADDKRPTKAPTSDTPGVTLPGNNALQPKGAPEDTPRDRVAFALAGKPPKSFVQVFAADVVAVAKAVPDDRLTPTARAVRDGAAKSLAESKTPDEQAVFQVAGQLAELLEAAGAQPV